MLRTVFVGCLAAILVAAGLSGWFAASAQDATPQAGDELEVPLNDAAGAEVGSVVFSEVADGVTMQVSVQGLEPGAHGIHLHQMGLCDASGEEPFASAGGHWNPTGEMHAGLDDAMKHAGDFSNLTAAEDGTATAEFTTDSFTLSDGPVSVSDGDGTSFIVHLMEDDLVSQPAGNSGGRYACGVVAEPMAMPTAATPEAVSANVVNAEGVEPTDELIAGLALPEGFEISVFAEGLTNPRMMAYGPDGTLYVTQPQANTVTALKDEDGDGAADSSEVVASNLRYVHGITIRDQSVYLAGEKQVWELPLNEDGTLGEPSVVVDELPDGDQHGRRTIGFGPDGMLYISLGSSCNVCIETNPENATIVRVDLETGERTIFASGLRNTLGWGWHPVTEDLWGMDMGSDFRGDEQPPDELNRIVEGGNYGWPFCYGEQVPDTYGPYEPAGATLDQYCANTEAPVLTYDAHSSPVGFVFYNDDQFPADFRGDAIVAMRGSWNRDPVVGYKLVRVHFEAGEPVEFEDFVTGWLLDGGLQQFGRVAGLVVAPDGSLLVSEDEYGVIYRVAYTGT